MWQGREVSYFSRGRTSPKTEIAFSHILFFVISLGSSTTAKVMQGSMQQPEYSTKTIFYERNDLVLFILNIMHKNYNMNIKCNQKFMFCKIIIIFLRNVM